MSKAALAILISAMGLNVLVDIVAPPPAYIATAHHGEAQ
jgi:hypothetical protein